MLNLFGAIANGLGRMLPGYTNGYRMAIQDNWQDLQNYNNVQQGQINNAFLEDTFPLAYNMWADRANNSRLAALLNTANFMQQVPAWPGSMQASGVYGANLPGLTQGAIDNLRNNWNMANKAGNMMLSGMNIQQPSMPQPQMPQPQMPQPQVFQDPNSLLNQNVMNRQAPSAAVTG